MIGLQLNSCPPGLRGDVTKWLMEISTGVYVGSLSLRTREALWKRVCQNAGSGSAVMVCTARNEQGFEFYVHQSPWQPVDFDGITLMRRPYAKSKCDSEINQREVPEPVMDCAGMLPLQVETSSDPEQQSVYAKDPELYAEAVSRCLDQSRTVCGVQAGGQKNFQNIRTDSAPPDKDDLVSRSDLKCTVNSVRCMNTQVTAHTISDYRQSRESFKKNYPVTQRRNNLPYIPWQDNEPLPMSVMVLDMETTGLDPEKDEIIEIGCIRIEEHKRIDTFQCLVQCESSLPAVIRDLTGITDEDLRKTWIPVTEAIPRLLEFLGDAWIIGHNAAFDIRFLLKACQKLEIEPPQIRAIDTISLSRSLLPDMTNCRLATLINNFHISEKQSHRALSDASLIADLYDKLIEKRGLAN